MPSTCGSLPRKLQRGRHSARSGAGDRRFIDRFESNCRFIATAYQTIIASVRDQEAIAPDAEWLVDNYYVVQEQLREIREDLPRNFYLELPKLSSAPFAGFPRVYELAHELVVHTDSSLDEELIAGFISSYQQVTPLTSGEIWAVPIMLRLVLVENLRRLCDYILASRTCRAHAAQLRIVVWKSGSNTRLPPRDDPRFAALVTEMVECMHDATGDHAGLSMREVARAAERAAGIPRRMRPAGTAASGGQSGDDRQPDHKHASRFGARLVFVFRASQPRRADFAA